MKYKMKFMLKQIMAFLCVIALLATQNSVSVCAINKTETEEKYATLGENWQQNLYPKMIYNGSNIGKASFDYNLNGIDAGDEVTLSATAEFSGKNEGVYQNVVLSEFSLEGADKDKYQLVDPCDKNGTITVNNGSILPRTISCTPLDENEHYTGESYPMNLGDIKEIGYTLNGVVEGETVQFADNINLCIVIVDNVYCYKLIDTNGADITNNIPTNDSNYTVKLDEEAKPIITDGNKPTIKSAVVKMAKEDSQNQLAYYEDIGIVSNNSVIVSVTAITDRKENTSFTLVDSENIQLAEPVTVEKNSAKLITNTSDNSITYEYTADFIIELSAEKPSRVIESIKCTVDNGIKSETTLKLQLENSENKTKKLILDNDPPKVTKDITVSYDNNLKQVAVTGEFEDEISGIKSIEYKWGNQTTYTTVPGLNFTTSYSDLADCEKENGKYKLHLIVTDNAGIQFTGSGFYCSENEGSDTKPPIIDSINFRAIKDDYSELELKDVLKYVNSGNYLGNYSNQTLKLDIGVKDEAENGIPAEITDVKLLDGDVEIGNNDNIQEDFEFNSTTNKYTLVLSKDCKIEDFKIKLVDKYNNQNIVSLKDELNKSLDIKLISNTWIIDKKDPTISGDYGSQVVTKVDGKQYYNIKSIDYNSKFTMSVTETNGLSSFIIQQKYKLLETDTEEITTIPTNFKDEDNDGKVNYEIKISDLETGWYSYVVSAIDNAGNSAEKQTFTFYVDKEKPKGNIEVINSDEKVIDSKNWIKEKNQDGKNQIITFRLYLETAGSNFESAKFVINDDFENPINVSSNKLNFDEQINKAYIDLEMDTSKLSDREKDACKNTFNISAVITTASGNISDEILYELHLDTEEPKITDFTVKKYENALEQILDILTFGIFSNKPITITLTVSDGANDAGIDYVTINHKYLEDTQKVKLNPIGNNQYTIDLEIPSNESIFSSNIIITAYDKLGKCTKQLPDKSNVENAGNVVESYFVMIEEEDPIATIELPYGESSKRNDGQTWYNSNDNNIELNVKDGNSGIRDVEVTVVSDDREIKITEDKNKIKLLTYDEIKTKTKAITEASYVFSINEIADIFKAYDNEKYTIKCKVVDNAGNVGYSEEKTFYRDTTNPTIQRFRFEPVTVNGYESTTEFVEKLEYGYYFKNEAKLFVAVDDTKNEDGDTVLSSGFDKVVFRLVSSEGDGKEQIIKAEVVNNEAQCIIPKGFKGQIYTQVFDMVGNYSDEKTSKAFVVDEEKPVITIEPLPDNKSKIDDKGNKLYTDTVNFKVTIKDTKSGLKSVSYSKSSDLDSFGTVMTKIEDENKCNINEDIGNGWKVTKIDNNLVTEVSKTFVFDKDDKNIYMTFDANDNSTNNAIKVNSEKFTIDTVSPTVEKFSFEPKTEDNISEVDKFIEELEYGFYFKKEFNAVVSVDDATPSSGLNKVFFRLVSYNNGEIVSEQVQGISVENKEAVCKIPAGFKGQIYAEVYDRADNKSGEKTSQGFVVDENPPTITIEPLPDNDSKLDMKGNKLYTNTVQFKVTISDEKAGLRKLVYSKSSEKDSFGDVITEISNTSGYKENDVIENGWQVTKTDNNLITEVSQVFTFNEDDNDIVMNFIASDRSKNTCEVEKSESFTIDTISPKVTITNVDDPINGMYYKNSTTYFITVKERNFDKARMVADITNTFTNAKPVVEFAATENDSNVYIATLVFNEGDYEFTFSGTDCGEHRADISTNKTTEISNYFHTSFNVDATAPMVTTNFEDFGDKDDNQIYFNTAQTATIEVVEHNFHDSDMNVVVKRKAPGTAHSADGENWYDMGYISNWVHDGDKHTLQIKFDEDGVYTISISPTDRAQNTSLGISSSIYEIDTTIPELYKRNDQYASDKEFVKSPYREVYDEEKKGSPAPSVEFEDLNFDRIEIEAVIYRPEYENGKEFGEIKLNPLSKELSVPVKSNKFTLPNFDKDGVYSMTYVAVDKAGNKSEPINDTYFRMVDTDVLAYINNSNIRNKTGYYSLMDEDGNPISKKASDFKDLSISVIKLKEDEESGVLTLREDDQKYSPKDYINVQDQKISETAIISETQLPASYFTETFRDDSLDTRMYLSVSISKDAYLDLATIHIDNEPPTITKPEDFVSWHNYFFTKEVTISLTNISETLNADLCMVYECPRNGEKTEIPFEYDKEKKMLSFVLKEGLHNIDIKLADEAGNELNVDRVKNLRVGNFRLYLGIGIGIILIGVIIGTVLWRKKKQN